MSVNSTVSKSISNGDNINSTFTFSFPVYTSSDLVVSIKDTSTDVITTLTISSGYTVSLTIIPGTDTYNGSVTLLAPYSPLAVGLQIIIQRVLPLTQLTVLADNEATPAQTYEDVFDKAVMLIQQLQEQVSRAILLDITNTTGYTFPSPTANYIIGWNAAGTALENKLNTALIAASASQNGYLLATDWVIFNAKQAALGYTPAHSGANSDITSLSGLTTALSIAQGGTAATSASDARTSLGLAIGTNVQAYNSNLTAINQALTTTSSPTFTALTIGSLAGLLKGTAGTVGAITVTTFADFLGGDLAFHTLNQAAVSGLTTVSTPTFAGIVLSGSPSLGYVWTCSNGTTGAGAWASPGAVPSGSVVQVVNYQRQDEVTCSTAVPLNNSSRVATEGDQVLTVAITPKSNSNKLKIDVCLQVGSDDSSYCAILLDGSTVLATQRAKTYNNFTSSMSFSFWITSPGTSAKTYNVRLGGTTANTYLNKDSVNGSLDNGKLISSITITEIAA